MTSPLRRVRAVYLIAFHTSQIESVEPQHQHHCVARR
jgi:hypothetical protein